MNDIRRTEEVSEELSATAIYSENDQGMSTKLTFIIDNYYVVTIDTERPGEAQWSYLQDLINFEDNPQF